MYQLWHKYNLVLEVKEGTVVVKDKSKLPFDLRHYENITYEHWLDWLNRRISTISRTYINKED